MDNLKLYLLNNKKLLIIPLVIILICILGLYSYIVNKNDVSNEVFSLEVKKDVYTKNEFVEIIEPIFISVDIKGKVKKPGVYRIDKSLDRRISDIITMAGGLLNDADTSVTNLSKKVFDEMVIIIYSKDEVKDFIKVKEEEIIKNDACTNQCDSCVDDVNGINPDNTTNKDSELVNINTASLDELMTLPGIGESKAEAIIEYRESNPFKTIDELMNVSGIGENVYNKIKDYITV